MPKKTNDCFPFFRFSLRYCMGRGEINGPRICYIQSVYLIDEGEGKFCYEDKEVNLFPGVHIYLPSGKKHTIVSGNKTPIVFRCMFFEWNYKYRPGIISRNDYLPDVGKNVIAEYIETSAPLNIPEFIVLENTGKWNYFFDSVLNNVNVYEPSNFLGSLKIFGSFLIFLDYISGLNSGNKAFIDPRIEKIINQMKSESFCYYNENVEWWAKSMGLSRSYFHNLFKLQTGFSPNAYWNIQRINKTIPDLINTNMTITNIAEKHHFESIHYYSKLFHKVNNETPSEYRRRYRI